MADDHLDYETLNRFLNGAVDRAGNMRVVRHLLTDCEDCSRLARELTRVHPAFSESAPLPSLEPEADDTPLLAALKGQR
jgi:hypothetical protein